MWIIWVFVIAVFIVYAFKPHFPNFWGWLGVTDRATGLQFRERQADEALYAVDPSFAIELGYTPPDPKPTGWDYNGKPLWSRGVHPEVLKLGGMIGGGLGKHAEPQQRYNAVLNSYYEHDKQLAVQEMFKAQRQQILQQRKNNEH